MMISKHPTARAIVELKNRRDKIDKTVTAIVAIFLAGLLFGLLLASIVDRLSEDEYRIEIPSREDLYYERTKFPTYQAA